MTQAGEQSVEQILHSIKQVMARDGAHDAARGRGTHTVTWNTPDALARQETGPEEHGSMDGWDNGQDGGLDPADAYEADEILDLAEGGMMMGSDTGSAGRPAMPFNQDAEGDMLAEFDTDSAPSGEAQAEREAHAVDRTGAAPARDTPAAAPDNLTDDEPLTSALTRDAMRGNLAALALLAEPNGAAARLRPGETSLEGLVREMLRPMLARWLDAHLPAVVERAVQAEVARIARAGR